MKKKRKRLDPKLAKAVEERSGGICEICGCRPATQKHHIFGGNGRRKQTERKECIADTCWWCHLSNEAGQKGVHFNKELDDQIKAKSQQELLNQGYTMDEVREITGGKIYL